MRNRYILLVLILLTLFIGDSIRAEETTQRLYMGRLRQ